MARIEETLNTLDSAAISNHRIFFSRIKEVEQELGIGRDYAAAIIYLRSKPYWTQSLEDDLITMSNNDEVLPNMLVYGKQINNTNSTIIED
ncbi:MAG TPA: hypothetical protein VI911_00745 [Patescibacteria group bacterium]|nr:hypothetical protein [Patescibacteria group bacterium]